MLGDQLHRVDGGTAQATDRQSRGRRSGAARAGDGAGAPHLQPSGPGADRDMQGSVGMKIFAFGSSIVSSYWNGAATYYRGCYKYLARRGHQITFAEPDAFGRQQHRDSGDFSYVNSIVYTPGDDVDAMIERAGDAEVVIKHSGIGVDDARLEQLVAEMRSERPAFFWDVDSPATLARMRENADD